jgi:hypothetical protein
MCTGTHCPQEQVAKRHFVMRTALLHWRNDMYLGVSFQEHQKIETKIEIANFIA